MRMRVWMCVFVSFFVLPLLAREKTIERFGEGVSVEVEGSQNDVIQAVQEVVADNIIRGSKEYNKDEYIGKADEVESTPLFPKWTDPGSVFYKVREQAIAPWNFKEANDVGTVAVRYVVQPKDDKHSIVRIDAVFVESFRKTVHPSNGSVEVAELKDIQDHVASIQQQRTHAAESLDRRQQELAKQALDQSRNVEASSIALAQQSSQTLEEHVQQLRRQVERLAKTGGATVRSAPFSTASVLKTIPAGSEVVILVDTPYWVGIETTDGQHGWVSRTQLDQLP